MKQIDIEMIRLALQTKSECTIRVGGQSMWPFIKSGDFVQLTSSADCKPEPGMIVAVLHDDSTNLIVHRIIHVSEKEDTTIVIAGDSSPGSQATIQWENVIGVVKKVCTKRSKDSKEIRFSKFALLTGYLLRTAFSIKAVFAKNCTYLALAAFITAIQCAGMQKKQNIADQNDDQITETVLTNEEFSSLVSPQSNHAKVERIYPGDQIDIVIYEKLPVSMEPRIEKKRVNKNGEIFIIPIGIITIGGLPISVAQDTIENRLSSYIRSPFCEISIVKRAFTPEVYIFGEVVKPGIYPLEDGDRLLNAIAAAGGCKHDAYRRSIKIVRLDKNKTRIISVSLYALMSQGKIDRNIILRDQDVVFVPRRIYTNAQEIISVISTLIPWYYFSKNFGL